MDLTRVQFQISEATPLNIVDDLSPTRPLLPGDNGQGCKQEAELAKYAVDPYEPPVRFSHDVELSRATTRVDLTENICYGALCNAKLRASPKEELVTTTLPWSRFHTFKLVARGEYYYLSSNGRSSTNEVSMLDLIATRQIHSLGRFAELSFTAVISSSNLDKITRKFRRKEIIIDISVNISGPMTIADDVGDTLADDSAYLQHPFFLPLGTRYINPQYLYPSKTKADLRHLIGPLTIDAGSMRVSLGLGDLLESLNGLPKLEISHCSQAISSARSEPVIVTKLKSHKEDGLRFIMSREDPKFCDEVASDLRSLIGARYFPRKQSFCLGGIVADVMGLGKTLTMLSAVVHSKKVASEFAKSDSVAVTENLTRATLIVVTSRQLLDVWASEIGKHLKPNSLNVALFHGDRRAKTSVELVDHDVVLTTYRTLMFDSKGGRVLQAIAWFRIVLDEAHWIRNQSSEQFKAAWTLRAERRWCITGTPIQNGLNDLRSLLSFLHFEPFADRAFFESHIVEPLRSESPGSLQNLKLLIRIICLRRSAIYLQLPPAQIEEISVAFTPEETAVYDKVLADCRARFDDIVSTKSEIKKYNIMFTTIMKLRRLCNHGTMQIATSDCSTPSGKKRQFDKVPISVSTEPFCEYCAAEDEDTATLVEGLNMCPQCSRGLGGQEVLSQSAMNRDSPTQKNGLFLPLPSSSLALRSFQSHESASRSPSPVSSASSSAIDAGRSSKLFAVAEKILESLGSSKNLVFTCWRSTLDIIANILTQRGVPCLQIDGRVGPDDRREILSQFRNDSSIPVLLMSIETGSVGLTLTVANRVHIVEPQWNPSVEEQAIARALRMGQTKIVTVFKYIMENTVEQNILTLQKKKSQLSKFSLDGGTDNSAIGRLDDLKFVLDTGCNDERSIP